MKMIITKLRSEGKIVLPIASSGITALLLPNGRSAHSWFHIPLKITAESSFEIKHGTHLAELLCKTSLIIWDEAPMANKYCFEALDWSLRDIFQMRYENSIDKPFGGLTIVLGGDFRQILSVVPKGGKVDIIEASLNSSYLWEHCNVFKLNQNMQLSAGSPGSQAEYISSFDKWLLQIGDGLFYDNPDKELIRIPYKCIVTS
ncbi:hypothetical protein Syun_015028 [Stephania yunnanensis]|uniref:ATP-dependent DNA helicase n=1 Tax=Stephania yunnanensis TaxID=152371 RepID=A0AAP0P916_9MAGN